MPKLNRVHQKVFAINSGNQDKVKFGSLAEGTPQQAANLLEVQERQTFDDGWRAAVLGALSPTLNDRNSLDYLITHQIAYILEQGVPEWDAITEYFTNSIVKGSDGILYRSLVDTLNINKDPSNDQNTDFWERVAIPSLSKKATFKNFRRYKKKDYTIQLGESFPYAVDSSPIGECALLAFGDSFYSLSGFATIGSSNVNADMVSCAASKTGNIVIGGNVGTNGDSLFCTNGGLFENITPVPSVITGTAPFRIDRVIHIDDGVTSYFAGICSLSSRILIVNESTPTTGTFEEVRDASNNVVTWTSITYDDVNDKIYIGGFSVGGFYMAVSADSGANWTQVNVVALPECDDVNLYSNNGIVYVAQRRSDTGASSYTSIENNGALINPFSTPLDSSTFPILPRTDIKLPDGRFMIADNTKDIGYITSDFRNYEYVAFSGSLPDEGTTLPFPDNGPQSLSYFDSIGGIIGWNSNATILSISDSPEL